MDDQDDLSGLVIDVHKDLLHQRAHELLFDARVGGGRVPGRAEIDGQSQQGLTVGDRLVRHDRLVEARLARVEVGERGIPASLELGRDQAVVGIDRLVPAPRELHGIPRLLAFELQRAASVGGLLHGQILRG
jgi:hypothetical protein